MNTSTLEHPSTDHRELAPRPVGSEFLGIGTWIVGRGQRVSLVRRGLRRRTVEAVVQGGYLDITHAPARPTFEMTLMVAGSTETVTVSTAAFHPAQIACCGVFHQRGRVPSLWLSVSAPLGGGITVRGDLNLNPA